MTSSNKLSYGNSTCFKLGKPSLLSGFHLEFTSCKPIIYPIIWVCLKLKVSTKPQRIQWFIIVSPSADGHSLSSNRLLLSLMSRAVAFHTFTRTCSGRGDEMLMSHPNTMNNHNKSPPTIMNWWEPQQVMGWGPKKSSKSWKTILELTNLWSHGDPPFWETNIFAPSSKLIHCPGSQCQHFYWLVSMGIPTMGFSFENLRIRLWDPVSNIYPILTNQPGYV